MHKMITYIVSVGMLLILCGTSKSSEKAKPFDIILPLQEKLQVIEKANIELAESIQDYNRNIRSKDMDIVIHQRVKSLDSFVDIARKWSQSTSMVSAKMMYGFLMFSSPDPNEIRASRVHFAEIAFKYKGFEGEISAKYFLPYLGLIEAAEDADIPEKLRIMKNSLQSLLDTAKAYDEKQDNLSKAVRTVLTRSDEPYFGAVVLIELARVSLECNEKQYAIDCFEQVIGQYPGTRWADKAAREINTIIYLEKANMPITGRLGYPRINKTIRK